jgi:hypothetical protein
MEITMDYLDYQILKDERDSLREALDDTTNFAIETSYYYASEYIKVRTNDEIIKSITEKNKKLHNDVIRLKKMSFWQWLRRNE